MLLVVLGGLIGLIAGGVRGLIVGAALGYLARWLLANVLRNALRGGLQALQGQLVESTFAVMGALCKADGVVTRDEIKTVEGLFARLHLSAAQREQAKAAFTRGKAADFDLDAEVGRFARACRGQRAVVLMFLQLQLAAVAADGALHPAEHAMLVRIARGLGLTERDVAQLEALLRASSGGPAGAGGGARPARQRLDDAYAALGLSAAASDAEIKQAYRRLMSQNHPDRLPKDLPPSMRELAEERAREVNTAYDLIKEARGMK